MELPPEAADEDARASGPPSAPTVGLVTGDSLPVGTATARTAAVSPNVVSRKRPRDPEEASAGPRRPKAGRGVERVSVSPDPTESLRLGRVRPAGVLPPTSPWSLIPPLNDRDPSHWCRPVLDAPPPAPSTASGDAADPTSATARARLADAWVDMLAPSPNMSSSPLPVRRLARRMDLRLAPCLDSCPFMAPGDTHIV